MDGWMEIRKQWPQASGTTQESTVYRVMRLSRLDNASASSRVRDVIPRLIVYLHAYSYNMRSTGGQFEGFPYILLGADRSNSENENRRGTRKLVVIKVDENLLDTRAL